MRAFDHRLCCEETWHPCMPRRTLASRLSSILDQPLENFQGAVATNAAASHPRRSTRASKLASTQANNQSGNDVHSLMQYGKYHCRSTVARHAKNAVLTAPNHSQPRQDIASFSECAGAVGHALCSRLQISEVLPCLLLAPRFDRVSGDRAQICCRPWAQNIGTLHTFPSARITGVRHQPL